MLFAWMLAGATPAAALAPPTVLLDPARSPLEMVDSVGWFGPGSQADIAAVSAGALPFAAGVGQQRLSFDRRSSLWLRLRLERKPGSSDAWNLQVPVTIVDRVTVYQQDAAGRWAGRSAGDMVPVAEWPRAGRYPTFPLRLGEQGPTDLYVEVRHSAGLKLPLQLVTVSEHDRRLQLDNIALGALMGVLGLLLVSSVIRSVLLRDGAHAWYSVFTALAMLSVAAFTGLAAQFVWGGAPAWMDAAPGCLTLLASGVAALLYARLSLLATRAGWVGPILRLLAFTGPLFAVVYLVVDRFYGVWVLGLQPLLVGVFALLASALTYRRGDVVGVWMLLGAVPLCLSVLLALLRATGLLSPSWASEYLLVLALTLTLPMLLVALNNRTQVRRSVELRHIALASRDALTGLMKRERFIARLYQTVLRRETSGESAAIAIVELRNFDWIRSSAGEQAAEEALLRTVIHLRRLLRDVDITGRLGENTFGVIVEGVALREGITPIASRLIATGLMHDPEQPREPELHLHVAAVMLSEHTAPADELLTALAGVLESMSARTQRAFRFYEKRVPGAVVNELAESGPGGLTRTTPLPRDA